MHKAERRDQAVRLIPPFGLEVLGSTQLPHAHPPQPQLPEVSSAAGASAVMSIRPMFVFSAIGLSSRRGCGLVLEPVETRYAS